MHRNPCRASFTVAELQKQHNNNKNITSFQPAWLIRRTVATPILLEELGQQPLADMWLLRAAGFWNSLMSGSAFHKAIAQDAVDLVQVRRTKGWLAGLSEALQAAGCGFQPQQLQCIDIGQLRGLLRDSRENAWDGLGICNTSAVSSVASQTI